MWMICAVGIGTVFDVCWSDIMSEVETIHTLIKVIIIIH